MQRIKLTPGDRYNRLKYVKEAEVRVSPGGQRQRQCLWQCDCGKTIIVTLNSVRIGHTTSCGCYRTESTKLANTTHGGSGTPTFKTWTEMRDRCNNPNNHAYKNYGGRGIKICKRWGKFENFLADMGPRLKTTKSHRYQIDRKNNNEGYYPDNCRWTLPKPNSQNTRASRRWHVLGTTFFSSADAALLLHTAQATIHRWCNGRKRSDGARMSPKQGCYSYPVYSKEKVL